MGLVVRDIEKSLKFYRDILGLVVFKREMEEGPFTDEFLAIKNVKVESIKLKIPNEPNGSAIELLQYYSHPDDAVTQFPEPISSNKLASAHFSFTVKDIESLYNRIMAAGYVCNSAPLLAPHGRVKTMYCHDSDGISVEIAQNIIA
jgi:catechol 2,3-dioxygenase-like lactoylglutathione lyase family enzyme